jgi:hypothetical protein
MKKVIILCPAISVTGGPELIHQFVDGLRNRNVDAKILYYPYSSNNVTQESYNKYNVEIATIDECNDQNSEIIVPEIATGYFKTIKNPNKTVWWLSIDNYFKAHPKNLVEHVKLLIKKYILKRPVFLKFSEMKDIKHLSQSYYGKEYLNKNGFENVMLLSDYLNESHLEMEVNIVEKKNIVAYNPKKGVVFTQEIIIAFPNIEFKPIQNMTAVEVASLLGDSKVYIDFGEHPGKDRIPREAAMSKCVVITGKKGSANNSIDLPILAEYKFGDSESDISKIGELIQDIFENFAIHCNHFDDYRSIIKNEPKVFSRQLDDYVDSLSAYTQK